MRFYIKKHKHYCGIDLHARTMYLCIINANGAVLLHRNIPTDPDAFLRAIAPFRDDLAVCVECIFTWYWLADLCNQEGIEFVLGHALYMKAIHGGKAKNDRIDSHKIAALLRGGMIPYAYIYPRQMRSTRDLLRRRTYFARKRAELVGHIRMSGQQLNLPDLVVRDFRKANRGTIAERFADTCARKNVELDVSLIDSYDQLLTQTELFIAKTTREYDSNTYYRLRSIPGIGKILALTLLYEIHDIERFPSVQDFLSYSRLVKCAKESAGKKAGSGGAKIGNVHLKWAFSEAAVLFLRKNPAGQRYRDRLENKHGKPKALSILAQRLGRAVYFMLKRQQAFNMKKFLKVS